VDSKRQCRQSEADGASDEDDAEEHGSDSDGHDEDEDDAQSASVRHRTVPCIFCTWRPLHKLTAADAEL
jgi:hypothetical protein